MEKRFFQAVGNGDVKEVEEILRSNPGARINGKNDRWNGRTALTKACENDHDSVVSILLAHPDIDVNLKTRNGSTPFLRACSTCSTKCVRLLLKDSRVLVNEPDKDGSTPLWKMAANGYVDGIRWWIASGREMNLGEPGDDNSDALFIATLLEEAEVKSLLERFQKNKEKTRRVVRVEIGWYNEKVGDVFALVVFASDGLLQVSQRSRAVNPAARFFAIATQLPLELQMVLCFRAVGSAKDIIPGLVSEEAFRDLASSI